MSITAAASLNVVLQTLSKRPNLSSTYAPMAARISDRQKKFFRGGHVLAVLLNLSI